MTSDHPIKRRKKLIEVAIPLEAINAASAREKSIRHGHPSTLHLWWARRPLAAARAVIFCQMVDDPSAVPEEFPTEDEQENERLRLFALISELVLWESTGNEQVLNRAREEIRRSWRRACVDNAEHPDAAKLFNPELLPGFHDPFAGGGAIPLEAQRLGLESYATDLNPVAVLINKAMIEIPPKFAGMPPVNPETRSKKRLINQQWRGAEGLAEDIRYYGEWLRRKAYNKIGNLYPKYKVSPDSSYQNRPDLSGLRGKELTVIAWIWVRTVKSPNPAFSSVDVPLASTFMLSSKTGKEAYIEPVIEGSTYAFKVRVGKPLNKKATDSGTKLARGGNFFCLMSGEPMKPDYIKDQAQKGLMGMKLMAVVGEGVKGKVFLDPTEEQEEIARSAKPEWTPAGNIVEDARAFTPTIYGLKKWQDLFTPRQLAALATPTCLISELRNEVACDFRESRDASFEPWLVDQDPEAISVEYGNAIGLYSAFAISRMSDFNSSLCRWIPVVEASGHTFARQAIAMSWDFVELNVFSDWLSNYSAAFEKVAKALTTSLPVQSSEKRTPARAFQLDAGSASEDNFQIKGRVISTDPPYYDNIAYADLSDYFYQYLRKSLIDVFPELLATLETPKSGELVATAYRHGGKKDAEEFFLRGMSGAMSIIAENANPSYPVTIYYAFKQSESKREGLASTGWEVFLDSVVSSGLVIIGTWPIRTELESRMRGKASNALATSIVLVCQRKEDSAPILTRSDFKRQLRLQLPAAVRALETSNIAPVDVAQAAIGPGMAIYSSARAVLNPDDSPMAVRDALVEINAALDEYLSHDEGNLDADSRFALTFFESFGYAERDFGDAEGLAKARNLSVDGVARAGILRSVAGKVQLLQRTELQEEWDPSTDKRLCIWEATQQLIKRLETGEEAAASLLAQLKGIPGHGDLPANCRALAYRLYNHCEKTKQAEEARAYNGLVIAWPELEKLAAVAASPVQASLL